MPHLLLSSALTPVMSESEAAGEMRDPGEKSCLSEPLSGLHFCCVHYLWPFSAVGDAKTVVAEAADWLAFSHLASDVSAKCFCGPLGDLRCAKSPSFSSPAPCGPFSPPPRGVKRASEEGKGLCL